MEEFFKWKIGDTIKVAFFYGGIKETKVIERLYLENSKSIEISYVVDLSYEDNENLEFTQGFIEKYN